MLKQLFIKDYRNTEDAVVRNKYGRVAGIFGIISNLILGIIKLFIGVISKSVSIMADAANNISDMATSILTIIGFKLSNKKPNKKHPYRICKIRVCICICDSFIYASNGSNICKRINCKNYSSRRTCY